MSRTVRRNRHWLSDSQQKRVPDGQVFIETNLCGCYYCDPTASIEKYRTASTLSCKQALSECYED